MTAARRRDPGEVWFMGISLLGSRSKNSTRQPEPGFLGSRKVFFSQTNFRGHAGAGERWQMGWKSRSYRVKSDLFLLYYFPGNEQISF